ncbi:uncharacterized protein LOC100908545 [Galendromus occidentalis]|uniref:Uncharacterized protein LOC100908545 n=1 Tax=Galendromus occidentalis TaxID=34638 RepID=A0AAJ6VWW8_9ACAR|nr:uncharacterized protein LOC100908545 [Galendromus occidentalis]
MKFALIIAAALAAASAVPVSRQSGSGYAILNKVQGLLESHQYLVDDIGTAGVGSSPESVQEEAEFIDEQLRTTVEAAAQNIRSDEASEDQEAGASEEERQTISEIRSAIADATAQLAKIVWELAQAHGGKLSDSLAQAKRDLTKRIKDLTDEFLVRLREWMIPADDVPVSYIIDEVFEQIVAHLKAQISDSLREISDWHNLMTEAGREKLAAAKQRLTELSEKIAETVREWRKEKSSDPSENQSLYGMDPFYDDGSMLMLMEVLEELDDELAAKESEASTSGLKAERSLAYHVAEVRVQTEMLLAHVRQMIKDVLGADFASSVLLRLRRLLNLKVQELQDLQNLNEGGEDSERIAKLEEEIMVLRKKIIQTIRDAFQRPS